MSLLLLFGGGVAPPAAPTIPGRLTPAAQVDDRGSIEIRGMIRGGILAVVAIGAFAHITPARLDEPEPQRGKITVGFKVDPPPVVPPRLVPVVLTEQPEFRGRITTGFDVAVAPAVVVYAPPHLSPVVLEPAFEMLGRVTVGFKVDPPPVVPAHVSPALLTEQPEFRGVIRSVFVVAPAAPAVVYAPNRLTPAKILEDFGQQRGRITPAIIVAVAAPRRVVPVVLVEPEQLRGKIRAGIRGLATPIVPARLTQSHAFLIVPIDPPLVGVVRFGRGAGTPAPPTEPGEVTGSVVAGATILTTVIPSGEVTGSTVAGATIVTDVDRTGIVSGSVAAATVTVDIQ